MMASDFIVEVNEADFEYQVLAYSEEVPVIVDFWAEWCVPCKVLGPVLERLALEADGTFRLAKVNVDENPNLARRYNVRGIPAVKAFKDGRMVSEFSGALPELQVRDFIRRIAPSQNELQIAKGNSLLQSEQPQAAEDVFQAVLDQEPDNSAALLGLAKAVLLQGRGVEAKYLLQGFPTSKEYASAELLRPLADALVWYENAVEEPAADPEREALDMAYRNALRLITRGNLEAALDGLLDVLRQDKRYRDGEARLVFLGLLEVMGADNPLSRQYRSELAAVLF